MGVKRILSNPVSDSANDAIEARSELTMGGVDGLPLVQRADPGGEQQRQLEGNILVHLDACQSLLSNNLLLPRFLASRQGRLDDADGGGYEGMTEGVLRPSKGRRIDGRE